MNKGDLYVLQHGEDIYFRILYNGTTYLAYFDRDLWSTSPVQLLTNYLKVWNLSIDKTEMAFFLANLIKGLQKILKLPPAPPQLALILIEQTLVCHFLEKQFFLPN